MPKSAYLDWDRGWKVDLCEISKSLSNEKSARFLNIVLDKPRTSVKTHYDVVTKRLTHYWYLCPHSYLKNKGSYSQTYKTGKQPSELLICGRPVIFTDKSWTGLGTLKDPYIITIQWISKNKNVKILSDFHCVIGVCSCSPSRFTAAFV